MMHRPIKVNLMHYKMKILNDTFSMYKFVHSNVLQKHLQAFLSVFSHEHVCPGVVTARQSDDNHILAV